MERICIICDALESLQSPEIFHKHYYKSRYNLKVEINKSDPFSMNRVMYQRCLNALNKQVKEKVKNSTPIKKPWKTK